ncbi:hypothetical protein GIB67_040409 [Kingdonia uniflora]|uniref:Creatinase N-terminal domain-containing protein n=1 Tax=Kingdonia uniflora TaxID=39325 RepID=A0A7J7KXN6_9MAGN|nr:hypothetical protein GIB67_040409 [Kingdonia uniflora]
METLSSRSTILSIYRSPPSFQPRYLQFISLSLPFLRTTFKPHKTPSNYLNSSNFTTIRSCKTITAKLSSNFDKKRSESMVLDDKLRALRELFSRPGIEVDAYIIPSQDAHQSEFIAECFMRRAYISGFTGSAGTAVVTKDKAALWTDGRYFLQIANLSISSTSATAELGQNNTIEISTHDSQSVKKNVDLGKDQRSADVGSSNQASMADKGGDFGKEIEGTTMNYASALKGTFQKQTMEVEDEGDVSYASVIRGTYSAKGKYRLEYHEPSFSMERGKFVVKMSSGCVLRGLFGHYTNQCSSKKKDEQMKTVPYWRKKEQQKQQGETQNHGKGNGASSSGSKEGDKQEEGADWENRPESSKKSETRNA